MNNENCVLCKKPMGNSIHTIFLQGIGNKPAHKHCEQSKKRLMKNGL